MTHDDQAVQRMTNRGRMPLNALRTFEACARLGSFLQAADELAVTPGAVSRQIQGLEAELGVRLFDRFNRSVVLTEPGARLAEGVADALSRLEEAVHRIRPTPDNRLVVSVLHSLAAKWLVPRLPLFEQAYPGVEVLVSASDRPVDLAREGVDVALRLGSGSYPGLDSLLLMKAVSFAVCSPRLLEGPNALRAPEDLAHVPLIHDITIRSDEPTWASWLAGAGVEGVDASRGQHFSNSYLAIDAAVAGRGVALADHALVIDDLAAGRLVRPFSHEFKSPYFTSAICLPERAHQPKIRRFRNWLVEQVAADGLQVT
jgi:LysR family transcriptional regulator, glycine cleavage system transcriptional activator